MEQNQTFYGNNDHIGQYTDDSIDHKRHNGQKWNNTHATRCIRMHARSCVRNQAPVTRQIRNTASMQIAPLRSSSSHRSPCR